MANATRNNSIDFWKVVCTLAIAMMHFINRCWWIDPDWINNLNPISWSGGYTLGFFLVTGGYFMVASYKSKQRKGLTQLSAGRQASEYSLGRWALLFPALLVGMIAGYIQICITNGYSLSECFTSFTLNFWDFTGLHAISATALPNALGGNAQFDINNTIATQVTTFNYPMWYISAILITSIAIYYILAKNEDLFRCVIAPFLSVAFLSAYAFSDQNWGSFREDTVLGLPIDIMWLLGGECIGALTWYLVDWLKHKEWKQTSKIVLTGVNLVTSVTWIYMIISNYWATHMTSGGEALNPASFNESVYLPLQLIVIVCCMLNHDYITTLLNRPFMSKLGVYSLYFFIIHYPMAGFVSHFGVRVFGIHDFYFLAAIFFIGTAIAGFLAMLLCQKVLEPVARKFFTMPMSDSAVLKTN